MFDKYEIKIAEKEDLEELIKFIEKPEIDNLFITPLSSRNITIEERVHSKFNQGVWLLLLFEGKIIGCRALIPNEKKEVMFSTFAIDPAFQKKGLGKKLYGASIETAKKKFKCKTILVDSWNTNKTAGILAAKFGFQKFQEFDDPKKRPKGIRTVIYKLEVEE